MKQNGNSMAVSAGPVYAKRMYYKVRNDVYDCLQPEARASH